MAQIYIHVVMGVYPLRMILPVTTSCLFSRCTRKSTVLPLSESSKDSESAIILLEHLNRMFATRITQNDRIRLQVLRNAQYSRSATVAREGADQSRPRAIRRLREDFPGDSGSVTSHVCRRLRG